MLACTKERTSDLPKDPGIGTAPTGTRCRVDAVESIVYGRATHRQQFSLRSRL